MVRRSFITCSFKEEISARGLAGRGRGGVAAEVNASADEGQRRRRRPPPSMTKYRSRRSA